MPRVHTVEKARKDYPDDSIGKGDKYYWWKFPYSSKIKSLTYPKRSQLTRSPYKLQAYDIDDNLQAIVEVEDLEVIMPDIENLKEEAQEALDNMPEHLQETSSSGTTLQQYIDDLEEWHNELEAIDTDVDAEPEDSDYQDKLEAKLEEIKEIGCPL